MSFATRYDSTFSLEILSVLSEGDAYGYLIQKRIQEASHGRIQVRPSTLYRLMQTLEQQQAVESWWDESTGRRRKWYRLTETGRGVLNQQASKWWQHVECLWRLMRPGQPVPQAHQILPKGDPAADAAAPEPAGG